MTSSVSKFVATSAYSANFTGLFPGSAEYSDVWREVADANETAFGQEQHDYIQAIYFDVAVVKLEAAIPGFDINAQCFGVLELIWSTAVQFGPTGCKNVFVRGGVQGLDTYDV